MECDVIVVGAGPAGLAFARGLNGSGLRTVLVERQALAQIADPAEDGRAIALTHRSVETLRRLGAWERIDPTFSYPLKRACVLDGGSPFALSIGPEGGDDRLGQLVANHHIRRALFAVAAAQPGLTMLTNSRIAGVDTGPRGAAVTLHDGRVLRGTLLVAADSRFSDVRRQLGISARINRLGKAMLVAEVAHEQDHRGIAVEWFGYGQTIALLPLSPRRSSVVLTLTEEAAARLARLDPAALSSALTRHSAGRLGTMELVGKPHIYPLATVWSRHFAARRAALIGDAAVGMHPVTAHGFNLGLRSAATLAGAVSRAASLGRDIAAPLLLRRYEVAHRLAAAPIFVATALIVRLYNDERSVARAARPLLLQAASRLSPVRAGIAHMLMQRDEHAIP